MTESELKKQLKPFGLYPLFSPLRVSVYNEYGQPVFRLSTSARPIDVEKALREYKKELAKSKQKPKPPSTQQELL